MEEVKLNSAPTVQPQQKSWLKKWLLRFSLMAVLVISFFVYWYYFNVLSDGTRTVYLVKISNKGNLFKTFEGEALVSIGTSPQTSITADKFIYSVTSKPLYDSLTKYEGQKMTLKYKQYRKTLPWRGDSQYIVIGMAKPVI